MLMKLYKLDMLRRDHWLDADIRIKNDPSAMLYPPLCKRGRIAVVTMSPPSTPVALEFFWVIYNFERDNYFFSSSPESSVLSRILLVKSLITSKGIRARLSSGFRENSTIVFLS